jgi:prevent-host-death family protein
MAIINKKCNVLPAIIHYVEKGPYVELTRRGKPVAVLLSIQDYERLSRKYTGFWSAVSEFRRKVEDEGIEISDRDFERVNPVMPDSIRHPASLSCWNYFG